MLRTLQKKGAGMRSITWLNVAWSARNSLEQAVREAVQTAMRDSENPVLALIFSAGDWDREALAQTLTAELGSLPWCGCTATAVFANRKVLTSGLALGVLNAPDMSVGIGLAGTAGASPLAVGGAAVARAIDHLPPLSHPNATGVTSNRAIILFADTFNGSGTDTVRGAVREGGTSVCWAGGGVGGLGRASGRMALLANGRAFLDRAIALAIDLPAPIGSGMAHGFTPQGPALTVTSARDKIVHQLEYRPAIDLYEQIAHGRSASPDGDRLAVHRIEHTFGIPQADGEYVLREPVHAREDGALEFVSSIPEGAIVRLMRSTPDSLIEGARHAARAARARLKASPGGALVFDCDARFLSLGDDFSKELDAIAEALGEDVPILGCTSYGEIGALGCGFPQFHNKTVHVMALPGEESLS